MSSTQQFISQLYNLGVKVHADGDRLRLRAPKGALTPVLRDELAARKMEILVFLQQVEEATSASQTAIRPVSRDGALPLSFAQQRLWFLQQLEGPSATYNMDHCVTLRGTLDVGILEQALQEIVRRHEVLRTCFPDIDGTPVQKIVPELYVPIQIIDLQDVSENQQSEVIIEQATKFVQQPFNLTEGPLLRTALLKGQSDKVTSAHDSATPQLCNSATFIFAMHHIISDGWSMDIFVQELIGLYEAILSGRSTMLSSVLPPLSIQYADYAQWQRQRLTGDMLQRQIDFWRDHLAGAPALLELPTDRPRPPVQSFEGAMEEFILDADLTARLYAFCRQTGASAYMTLQSAFVILLMRYSGQEDIVIGTPIANRTYQELEPLIGFFVNTLALRTDLADNPTFAEVVDRTRQNILDAQAHQDIPFERLVEELKPARNMSHNPIFQVMFVLQNVPEQEVALADLQITPFDIDKHTSKFDLTLSLYETKEQSNHQSPATSHQPPTANNQSLIEGTFEYSTDLFDQVTIQRMVAHFKMLLADALRDHPISKNLNLTLLPDHERQQIVQGWNDTGRDYNLDTCLHHWFEAQVEREPNHVALVFEDQVLTYAELNARANQLAHHLHRLGVRPGDNPLVGVCMERSIEMVVSLYAILKAGGGAYVPMDPDYPTERLRFMNGRHPVLLTQARFAHLAQPDTHVIMLDRDWAEIAHESTENPNIAPAATG